MAPNAEVGEFKVDILDTMHMPHMPNVYVPNVHVLDVHLPNVHVPNVHVPTAHVPCVHLPNVLVVRSLPTILHSESTWHSKM